MRRFFFCFILQILLVSALFAQTVKVIDVKGKVLVKKDIISSWQEVKLGMLLERQAEIKTAKNSECSLTFDKKLKNILTVKENSQVKIEDIVPGKIFLPQGRVFALVENIKKIKSFKVRTPVAIAGARGTGWSTNFGQGGASFLCYEDSIHIQGLSPQGNVTGEEDISEGSGINVGLDGELGEIFELTGGDFQEWDEFKSGLEEKRREQEEEETKGEEIGEMLKEMDSREEGVEETRDEGQQDQRQDLYESQREEEEATVSGGEEPPGGGKITQGEGY